jgi:hypothetical protein
MGYTEDFYRVYSLPVEVVDTSEDTILTAAFKPPNSTQGSTTSPPHGIIFIFRQFVFNFGHVAAVILVSGFFGNLLSIVVFFRLRRRDMVTSTYL